MHSVPRWVVRPLSGSRMTRYFLGSSYERVQGPSPNRRQKENVAERLLLLQEVVRHGGKQGTDNPELSRIHSGALASIDFTAAEPAAWPAALRRPAPPATLAQLTGRHQELVPVCKERSMKRSMRRYRSLPLPN
jgi:hypothetical protein